MDLYDTGPRGDLYWTPSRGPRPSQTLDEFTAFHSQWTAADVAHAAAEGRHEEIEQARVNGQLREVLDSPGWTP